MRFYLDFPLVAGYVLMATTACLGMLQFAAARGGYAGLSLFTEKRRTGVWVGAGIGVAALLGYVSFAPEILTPGPAGSEVAEMFALCALVALGITLAGADRRIRRQRSGKVEGSVSSPLDNPVATLVQPLSPPPDGKRASRQHQLPAVLLLPDFLGLVTASAELTEALRQAEIVVVELDTPEIAELDAPLLESALENRFSTALSRLTEQPAIDQERIGLLGLGLTGDALLSAAPHDRRVKGVLAVSPVRVTSPERPRPSVEWLRELSIRQAWSWRHNWPVSQRAATAVGIEESEHANLSIPMAVVYGSHGMMATRKPAGPVEALAVSSWRHFTLLEDERARRSLVQWFEERLTFR